MSTEGNTDKILRALALLTALRQNTSSESITEYNSLSTSHVTQFHEILNSISSIGIDVKEFFIPDQEVKPKLLSISSVSGPRYSEERYIRKSLFLTKVDGIMNYLEMLLKEKPRKTGFQPRS